MLTPKDLIQTEEEDTAIKKQKKTKDARVAKQARSWHGCA